MATIAANDAIPSQEAVGDRMRRMPERVGEAYRTGLGTYRGLICGLIHHALGGTEVYLEGVVRCREHLLRDDPGPRAVLNALGRLAGGYGDDCRRIRAEIGIKQSQLEDYDARLGRPFAHEAYRRELAALRDLLRLGLSEHPPEGLPPVAELAGRIKGLRGANTVEAAPERAAWKEARAERPVTARIRQRMAEPAAGEMKPEPQPTAPAIAPPAIAKRAADHRQQIPRRHQGDTRQLSLF